MKKTFWAWVSPLALLAALMLAGCGGGGGGGGGSSSGNTGGGGTVGGGGGGGGGTTTGTLALTATPAHGFVALSWTLSNATSGVTYTVQRATSSTGTFVTIPNGNAITATSVNDYPTGTAPNTTDPAVGSSYVYRVLASNGVNSSVSNTVSPSGPAAGSAVLPGPTSTPFVNNTSGSTFTYTVTQAGARGVQVTLILDYTPTATDLRNITFNENNGDQIYQVSANASQLQASGALTVSGNAITFDTTKVAGLSPAIPDMIPGALVTINAYVNTASGNTTNPAVVQLTAQVPPRGSTSTSGNTSTDPSKYFLFLNDQVQ